jgi:hypothetical protein
VRVCGHCCILRLWDGVALFFVDVRILIMEHFVLWSSVGYAIYRLMLAHFLLVRVFISYALPIVTLDLFHCILLSFHNVSLRFLVSSRLTQSLSSSSVHSIMQFVTLYYSTSTSSFVLILADSVTGKTSLRAKVILLCRPLYWSGRFLVWGCDEKTLSI